MKAYQNRRSKFGTIALCVGLAVIVIVVGSVFGWWDRAHSQAVQQKCLPLDLMLKAWEARYGEVTVASAVGTSGKLVFRLLLSPDGTFTLLGTNPDGMTCALAAGEDWHFDNPPPSGKDS